jgi:pantoate--beta-alanine ligase
MTRPESVTTVDLLRPAVGAARAGGKSVGLVPTMGALHAGHTSLLDLARRETDFVVCTIFVNPTQFGPHEDLSRYPRPFEKDLELCARHGVDLVFAPTPDVMYPAGFSAYVEVTGIQDVLEGASRPGHFRGVATVVLKLFNLVQPDRAYFGQKDAQQVAVIRRMVRDLDVPLTLRIGPTVREPDGLALSSRNVYLDPTRRAQAPVLYRALLAGRNVIEQGERNPEAVRRTMADTIATAPDAVLDYAAVVAADTFAVPQQLAGDVLLLLAVRFGSTRLIDNTLVSSQ